MYPTISPDYLWTKQPLVLGICENNKSQVLGEMETAEEANSENLDQILNSKYMPNKFWDSPPFVSSLNIYPKMNALSVSLCTKTTMFRIS